MTIADAYKKVPMMYRAQVGDRSQLQYIKKDADSDIKFWTSEWIERTYPYPPSFTPDNQTRTITASFNWRFVTNGGQDDGIIRPVIGAKGYPFYPGSSMKGAFSRACTPIQRQRYCGKPTPDGDVEPGILRFHGGYPVDKSWQDNLIDIVHPQQCWQVQDDKKEGGAFAQISLYQPTLCFAISSTITLKDREWEIILDIWQKAISTGLGCRVSAGYGQPKKFIGNILYQTELKGTGIAAKLLDDSAEFRTNIFRAGIRGHALRVFGGLTDEKNAETVVEKLFGGTKNNGGTVGLLSMNFQQKYPGKELGTFGSDAWEVDTYDVEGCLNWGLTQTLPEEQEKALKQLIQALTRFGMVFGGFGKSWRRVDHRQFYPEYYAQKQQKPLIGCHWQWNGNRALIFDVKVYKLEQVSKFINEVQEIAKHWLKLQKITITSGQYATSWRESWHQEKVQVWGRIAENEDDCRAIKWLHQPYRKEDVNFGIKQGSIYKSLLTGQMSQIGRLWHRMYPVIRLLKDPKNPKKPIVRETPHYLELLTIFPDDSEQTEDFLAYLSSNLSKFEQLW
ncbi:RAMP superfamily protein [Gloeothece citriformis]|nr:RAMP superfamily protein [Gloeothece citriformis]